MPSVVLPSEGYEAKLARRDYSEENRLLRRPRYQEGAERRRAARETRDELFRGGLGFVVGDAAVTLPGSSSGAAERPLRSGPPKVIPPRPGFPKVTPPRPAAKKRDGEGEAVLTEHVTEALERDASIDVQSEEASEEGAGTWL